MSAAAIAVLLTSSAAIGDDLTRPMRGETPGGRRLQFLGTNSCSSGSCHNRGSALGADQLSFYEPRPFSEHGYWRRYDPHVNAFEVLTTDRSDRILARFRRPDDSDNARADRDGLCLSCHVHQNFDGSVRGPGFTVSEGVGCESCHGASELWTSLHYQDRWDFLGPAARADLGFVPLESLGDRARSCMPCHVGSSYSDPTHELVDVNHDLIAAGHPRLMFEFASYYAQYPKHWPDVDEYARDPALEARAWAVGQLAATAASVELLEARAERSSRLPRPLANAGSNNPHAGPWPEFSEYNCYACHHDLRGGVPLEVGIASAVPGEFAWSTWSTAMTSSIADVLPPADGSWESAIADLSRLMSDPLPAASGVIAKSSTVSSVLDRWIAEVELAPIDASVVARLSEAVATRPDRRGAATGTWDQSTQDYLALAALYSCQLDLDPTRRDPALARLLETMRARLRFRPETDSPETYRADLLAELLSNATARPVLGPGD